MRLPPAPWYVPMRCQTQKMLKHTPHGSTRWLINAHVKMWIGHVTDCWAVACAMKSTCALMTSPLTSIRIPRSYGDGEHNGWQTREEGER